MDNSRFIYQMHVLFILFPLIIFTLQVEILKLYLTKDVDSLHLFSPCETILFYSSSSLILFIFLFLFISLFHLLLPMLAFLLCTFIFSSIEFLFCFPFSSVHRHPGWSYSYKLAQKTLRRGSRNLALCSAIASYIPLWGAQCLFAL